MIGSLIVPGQHSLCTPTSECVDLKYLSIIVHGLWSARYRVVSLTLFEYILLSSLRFTAMRVEGVSEDSVDLEMICFPLPPCGVCTILTGM